MALNLNERERFRRLFDGEHVDRPPLLEEGVRKEVIESWHKQGLPSGRDHLRLVANTKEVTGLLFGVKRISGSRPRLPMIMILFKLISAALEAPVSNSSGVDSDRTSTWLATTSLR